jgi:hypothetical protein
MKCIPLREALLTESSSFDKIDATTLGFNSGCKCGSQKRLVGLDCAFIWVRKALIVTELHFVSVLYPVRYGTVFREEHPELCRDCPDHEDAS